MLREVPALDLEDVLAHGDALGKAAGLGDGAGEVDELNQVPVAGQAVIVFQREEGGVVGFHAVSFGASCRPRHA
ncbi:MAG: hypothetical protein IKT16_00805, partial [Desulfovibrio sp.]|nr:hypothetical protein [Desulfovibrio sp.]